MHYTDFFKGYIKNYFKDSNFSGDYIHEDGTKASYINGKLSYIGYSNGTKEWWIDGIQYTEHNLEYLYKICIFLGKEKGKYNLDWLKFLAEDGVKEFPIIPGMEEDSEFKPFFELIK